MSDSDSFIQEVSEEVRRDKLFRLMKRWGWIPILLVILLVGGAAFNEWQKARNQTEAQAFGDEILAALQDNEPGARGDALDAISAQGDQGALLALLASGEAVNNAERGKATDALRALAADETLGAPYRQLAELELILLQSDTLAPAERIARLEPLAIAGAPFRLLAEEQIAIAQIEAGDIEAAISRLQAIMIDQEATQALRRRASQLIVALGGELVPA
ncbi:MAG: hypothetical protein ACC619_00905 [Paracoccaceae bacterium]